MSGQEFLLLIIAALHAKPHKTVAVMVVPNAVSLINSQINHVKKRDDVTIEGCTATIYKVDLMKHSCEASVSVPVMQLFCELLPQFRSILFMGEWQETSYNVPPHPVSSRHYLALYSVLLI